MLWHVFSAFAVMLLGGVICGLIKKRMLPLSLIVAIPTGVLSARLYYPETRVTTPCAAIAVITIYILTIAFFFPAGIYCAKAIRAFRKKSKCHA